MRDGLTATEATRICQRECGAQCCRGPQYLRLSDEEGTAFAARAEQLGVYVRLRPEATGGVTLRFPDHDGDRCPMLDAKTLACRMYEDRPERCRKFPEGPRPGCAIS